MSAIGTIIIRTAGGAIGTMIVNRGPAGPPVTVETTIIEGNTNAVSGNAVFDAINALTGAVAPTAPGTHVGQQYRDTVTSIWYRWTGTVWQEDAGASTAADVAFTPAGGIAATDVQAALVELAGTTPTDYEITSAVGRRLIASLKVAAAPSAGRSAYFTSTKSSSIIFSVITSTGYAKPINSVGTYGSVVGAFSGNPANAITLTIAAAGVHRAFGVVATDSGGTPSGNLLKVFVSLHQLTAIDVASATALTLLDCGSNQLTELDVSENTALTSITGNNNQLTDLDVGANLALTTLNLQNNLLTTAAVDQILVDLDAHNVDGTLVSVDGTGNGAASATGIAAANRAVDGLLAEGWNTVAYNV